jgi:hypothetical protein
MAPNSFFCRKFFQKILCPSFEGLGSHARAGGAPRITKHLLPAGRWPRANHAALDVRVISADEDRVAFRAPIGVLTQQTALNPAA